MGGSQYPHADARERSNDLLLGVGALGVFWGESNKAAAPAKMFINAHILSAFMHAKAILVQEELGPLDRRRRHRG